MQPQKPKRIEVNPAQGGLAGMANAFSGLHLGPLPDAPAQPTSPAKPEPALPVKPKKLGRVVLRKETAHRGGKAVIVVYDFPPTVTQSQLDDLARQLRKAIGTGGAVKDRTVEIQGDQAAKIRAFLEGQGWQVAGV